MTRTTRALFLFAAGLVVLAAAISPGWLADRFLPPVYSVHREMLVKGLWTLRLALLLDAVVLLGFVRWLHVFSPAGCYSRPGFTLVEKVFLFGVVLLAASIRLVGIGQGFSYDEIFMYQSLMAKSIPAALARAESWRALYGVLGNVACVLPGQPEITARLPALVFGVAAAPVLYCLVRWTVGRLAAGVAAVFLVLSTFHVWYSQDASAYSMAFLFSIAAIWALQRALNESSGWPWLVWGMMLALVICSHWYLGGLLLAGQVVCIGLLFVSRRISAVALGRAAVVLVAAGAACLTFMALSIPRQIRLFSMTFTETSQRGPMFENLIMLGQHLFQAYASPVWQLPLAAVCCVGGAVSFRSNRFVFLSLALPSLIMLVHWLFAEHQIVCMRYALLALLPVSVFFGIGAVAVASFVVRRLAVRSSPIAMTVSLAVITVPLLMSSWESLGRYYARDRYPIRPAAEYAAGLAGYGRNVYFGGFAFDKFSYYAGRLKHLAEYEQLRSVLVAGDEFWLVYWFPNYHCGMPEDVLRMFNDRAKLCFRYTGFRQSQSEHDYESFCWHVKPVKK